MSGISNKRKGSAQIASVMVRLETERIWRHPPLRATKQHDHNLEAAQEISTNIFDNSRDAGLLGPAYRKVSENHGAIHIYNHWSYTAQAFSTS